jgi:hypothetical protein
MKGSKAAGIGAVVTAIVAAVIVGRSLQRPDELRSPPAVVTTPREATAAPERLLDPTARAAPAEASRSVARPPMPVPPAPPSAPAPPDALNLADDTTILAKVHDLAASDPEQSLWLAREALERFPRSSHASEFEWNVVKALFNMGRVDDAKDEARTMVRSYPNSDFTGDVERHLLNPQPNQ